MKLTDFNNLSNFGIEDPRMTTIGGVAFRHLDRLPRVGDDINVEGVRITVLEMEAHRIARVRVARGLVALEREGDEPSGEDTAEDALPPTRDGSGAGNRPRDDTAADAAQDTSLRTGEESHAGALPSEATAAVVGDAISEPSAGSVEIEDTRSTPRAPDLHARSEAEAEAEAEGAPDSPDGRPPRSGSG